MELILASTSRYRRALLERLQIPFRCVAPEVDETPGEDEPPRELALRLARRKARVVAEQYPEALVLGSDQVASLEGNTLGKPGGFERARDQLCACSGKRVDFYTGLALVGKAAAVNTSLVALFSVHFRHLERSEIDHYLRREQPYDCAGSFKWEGLGIALFKRLEGEDPTALEGLPLIATCGLLREAGIYVLEP